MWILLVPFFSRVFGSGKLGGTETETLSLVVVTRLGRNFVNQEKNLETEDLLHREEEDHYYYKLGTTRHLFSLLVGAAGGVGSWDTYLPVTNNWLAQ
jgi:hypothetical protein